MESGGEGRESSRQQEQNLHIWKEPKRPVGLGCRDQCRGEGAQGGCQKGVGACHRPPAWPRSWDVTLRAVENQYRAFAK